MGKEGELEPWSFPASVAYNLPSCEYQLCAYLPTVTIKTVTCVLWRKLRKTKWHMESHHF